MNKAEEWFKKNYPHIKDGGLISTKIIAEAMQQYAREREVELINFLKKSHPYPKNIFIPLTNEQWKKFHKTLRDAEISGDGFAGAAARMGYDACIYIIKSNQEGE